MLYFVVSDLVHISYMYQFSLEWFHKVFVDSMDSVSKTTKQITLSDSDVSLPETVQTVSRQRRHSVREYSSEVYGSETIFFRRHVHNIIDKLTNNVYKVPIPKSTWPFVMFLQV